MAINLFGQQVNIHPRYGNNFLDANALDQCDGAMNEILRRADAFEFTLLLPYSVQAELQHPHTPQEVKRKAANLLFSVPVVLTPGELAVHQKIGLLMQGNAQAGQHAQDAFHIVESAKNGGRHFITNDKRILKKAPEIWRELQMRVLTPQQFIDDYF